MYNACERHISWIIYSIFKEFWRRYHDISLSSYIRVLNFAPEEVFLGVLPHFFNMKLRFSAKSHRISVEVYDAHALAERTCQK